MCFVKHRFTTCFSFCQGEASRYIFLNKFRKFLQENASNRGVSQRASLPASLTLRALCSFRLGTLPFWLGCFKQMIHRGLDMAGGEEGEI